MDEIARIASDAGSCGVFEAYIQEFHFNLLQTHTDRVY